MANKPQSKCTCGKPRINDGGCEYQCLAIKAANHAAARGRKQNEQRRRKDEQAFSLIDEARDGLARISPTYAAERALCTRRAKTGHARKGAR